MVDMADNENQVKKEVRGGLAEMQKPPAVELQVITSDDFKAGAGDPRLMPAQKSKALLLVEALGSYLTGRC